MSPTSYLAAPPRGGLTKVSGAAAAGNPVACRPGVVAAATAPGAGTTLGQAHDRFGDG